MFRGHFPTRLDDNGRLKIPADFKRETDKIYENGQFYITSFDGVVIQLYPLKEWELFEAQATDSSISYQKRQKFLDTTSYYGQMVTMDNQGRLTIADWLREEFGLKGEVAVVGKREHIEIQREEDYKKQVKANLLTPEDMDELTRKRIA